jgi:hypothetical protein
MSQHDKLQKGDMLFNGDGNAFEVLAVDAVTVKTTNGTQTATALIVVDSQCEAPLPMAFGVFADNADVEIVKVGA